ncbi:MAG: sensor histidine kinase, partial [Thermodesulfovibrionales bacterium]
EIIKNHSDRIPDIMVDRNKIEQVFLNIILNAIQAMNGPGKLIIKTSLNNGHCIISFRDTGPGIPHDVMPYIFDPFFTTKPVGEGTGLGLSVSKSIVEQHGGRITVESTEGMTEFKIELPVPRPWRGEPVEPVANGSNKG